ncbi:hypothetical protein AVEN_151799-1 [Araneus ventricosus]|uniref:Uncharacterized protein n=1 Tax=Araneus ventricosus TaxID=182803 RepID=A0A4Y2PGR2_ARAVE|nr:hypothetical protein AVEN_98694-1 [Araneus ventricosus]GBN49285.1 hypothetical protein AVEN_35922-1 [Araneus ventricosus]GBN49294.1 hypothetical protein AVEN_41193-1 [Araneus ventricosus]GBN49347.1 hypothetical protein AVEN_151799-1 [Araneus ventricosus]
MCWIFPCDVTVCRTDYIRTVRGSQWVYRLERLESFVYSARWTVGELRAIERTVTAITSELLTVCVAKSKSAVTDITCELLSVALLICSRSVVPVTCATCFPKYLGINLHSPLSCVLDCFRHIPIERFLLQYPCVSKLKMELYKI